MLRVIAVIATLAGAVALAGCGKSGAPPTAEEIKAEAAKLPKQRPGLYATATRMVDFAIDGVSPQDAGRARAQMLGLARQSRSECLTQQQADQGFEATIRDLKAGNCKTDRFAVDSGQLDAQLTCTNAQGVTSKIGIEGTNTVETSHARITLEQVFRAQQGVKVEMVLETDSLRQGDCR